jgi:predicted RNase H-like HicB family nuclease
MEEVMKMAREAISLYVESLQLDVETELIKY